MPGRYDVMQLFWKTGDDGTWWDLWKTRVIKKLTTACQQDADVHAYCVFGAGHPSSANERSYVKGIEAKFPKVTFHFTKVALL